MLGCFEFFAVVEFYLYGFLIICFSYFYFICYSIVVVFFLLGLFFFVVIYLFLFSFFSFCWFLNIFDSFFYTKLASLLFLSKDIVALEEEDLWISSNFFFFDRKVSISKDFKISLTSNEIEVFYTLIQLFFNLPLKNNDYLIFSNELFNFRHANIAKLRKFKKLPVGLPSKAKRKKLRFKLKFTKFNKYTKLAFNNKFKKKSDIAFPLQLSFKKKMPLSKNLLPSSFFYFLFRLLNFYSPAKNTLKLQNRYSRRQRLEGFRRKTENKVLAGKTQYSKILHLNSKPILHFRNSLDLNNSRIFSKYVQYKNTDKIRFKYSEKFSPYLFSMFRDSPIYSQHPELSRFRKFFWFSFPFYILEVNSFVSLGIISTILHLLQNFISKVVYSIFFLLGEPFLDVNPLFLYTSKDYKPMQKKSNFLKFLWFDSDNSKLFYDLPNLNQANASSSSPNKNKMESIKDAEQPLKKNKFTTSKKKSRLRKRKKKQKKRNQKYIKRKLGHNKKKILLILNRYRFLNKYNTNSRKFPELNILNTYQLLEYFYFVTTQDIDLYDEAVFNAKVSVLRDAYGQSIVKDLLSRSDHKQAAKVSVIMHIQDHVVPDSTLVNVLKTGTFDFDNSTAEDPNIRLVFPQHSSQNSKFVSNFRTDLILSYKSRFR